MVLVPSTTGSLSWMRAKKGREGCAVITPGELQSMALRKDSLGRTHHGGLDAAWNELTSILALPGFLR